MRVYLYDEFDHVIPNPNGEFSIKITYPPTFNDTNSQREVSLFSARHFFCRYVWTLLKRTIKQLKLAKKLFCFRSTYQDEGQSENDFIEQCEVHGDFDDYDFQPTPDGVYIFALQDPTHQVNLNFMTKMIVEMDGSWIPFEKRKIAIHREPSNEKFWNRICALWELILHNFL